MPRHRLTKTLTTPLFSELLGCIIMICRVFCVSYALSSSFMTSVSACRNCGWLFFLHLVFYLRIVQSFHKGLSIASSCLSNAILTDYIITLVSVRVCVSVHRSVVERLRPQFFTDFHQISHAAQKCGCFERYCFWNKPEVVYRF